MIVFDDIYSWSGKTHTDKRPVSWWPGSYRVKIVDLSDTTPDGVVHLKPFVCLFVDTGAGFNVRTHFQYFAQSLCREFELTIHKVLWVECFGNDRPMEVAAIRTGSIVGRDTLYHVEWRSLHKDEAKLVKGCNATSDNVFK